MAEQKRRELVEKEVGREERPIYLRDYSQEALEQMAALCRDGRPLTKVQKNKAEHIHDDELRAEHIAECESENKLTGESSFNAFKLIGLVVSVLIACAILGAMFF